MGGPYDLKVEGKREDPVVLVPVCPSTAIAKEEMQLMLEMRSKRERERKTHLSSHCSRCFLLLSSFKNQQIRELWKCGFEP